MTTDYNSVSFKSELTEILNSLSHSVLEMFMYEDGDIFDYEIKDKDVIDVNAGKSKDHGSLVKLKDLDLTIENVEHYGGDGEGETYYTIYKFSKNDEELYIQFDGYYASFSGADYNKWFYVYPKEVVVTQYFLLQS